MKKADFWRRDWFLGLLVTLAMLVWAGSEFNQSLERKAYDIAVGMTDRTPSGADRITSWPSLVP